jgi:hypothetical protein
MSRFLLATICLWFVAPAIVLAENEGQADLDEAT